MLLAMGVPKPSGYAEHEPGSAPEVLYAPHVAEVAPTHSPLYEPALPEKKKRSRRTLWIVLVAVAAFVIVGAVVGGVVGTRSKKSNRDGT